MEKTALVLAGGGSRGSYELGVWQALREMDIDIDIVTGTSIGAINGALIAQGDYDTAVELWNKIETSHVFEVEMDEQLSLKQKVAQAYKTFFRNFVKSGGTDTHPLRQTLSAYFDEQKIRFSPIEYGVVTMEMDSRQPRELFCGDIPQGKMIDYILASASIYPAFKPYVIDGVRYIDGCYHDNMPVKMALERGATSVIAVDLEAFGVVRREELRLAREVKYLRSQRDLGPTLVFDHTVIRRNIRLGYLDTLKAYGAYEGGAFTYLPGFTARLTELFSQTALARMLLPPEEQATGWEHAFRGRIVKFLEDRGMSGSSVPGLALICAETAGETFELSPEPIYSEQVWLKRLKAAVDAVKLPEGLLGNANVGSKRRLLDSLRETATLLNRQVRTKFAALLVREMLRTEDGDLEKQLGAFAVLPDAFLGGAYLALCDLI